MRDATPGKAAETASCLETIRMIRAWLGIRMAGPRDAGGSVDLRTLTGEQWLRLLTLETHFTALVGWCPRCHAGERLTHRCGYCGTPVLRFDQGHWDRIAGKIRKTLRRDRALLSRVKTEREHLYGTLHQPRFPEPLDWLRHAWEEAPKPSHRPFDPALHYRLANVVQSIQEQGLTHGEIADVMGEEAIKEPSERRRKHFGAKSVDYLSTLREGVRRLFGYIPSAAWSVIEMGRTCRWVQRQRTVPMARLRGERIRDKMTRK
jgi:hypothetical protein